MMNVPDIPGSPPAELLFRRRVRLIPALSELWGSRPLIRTLAERDLRVRYKQATLGFAWAVLTPFVLMVVFSIFFQRVARVDTGGAPYPIFVYVGLIPWAFFSASVSQGGSSIVANKALLNKVYCPREVFPIASVGVAAVDASMSLVVLCVLFIVYRFMPAPEAAWLPLLFLAQVAFTLGVTFLMSAALVYLRDLLHALPLLLQFGLLATPVAYGLEMIPAWIRGLYAVANPLGPIIDGYRAALLFGRSPDWPLVGLASLSAACWLIAGFLAFKRLEMRFADVA